MSVNMPWVSADGFAPYLTWLRDSCEARGIHINGNITQRKNAYTSTVFCVPTNIGNVFMKIPGRIYISELIFTHGLNTLNIANLPYWIDYNSSMNAFLMKDMGGHDIQLQSDTKSLRDVILRYAKIQKDSIRHLPLSHDHYDRTVETVLKTLNAFPHKAYAILKGTQNELRKDELRVLKKHVKTATALLKLTRSTPIPNTIQHGDFWPGNIRAVDGTYVFYDWAWGGVSHPFVEIASFLHIIKWSQLVDESENEVLTDVYIHEWLEYGTYNEIKFVLSVFTILKDMFIALVNYDWLEAIMHTNDATINTMSADGWLAERKIHFLANTLRRFIKTPLESI